VTASQAEYSNSECLSPLDRRLLPIFQGKVAEQAMTFQLQKSDFSAAQKEARALLRSLQRRDPVATGRYQEFDAFDVSPTRLADAQYLVARRYGFKSWAALKSRLTE
jgi:hypothetical protein